MPDRNIEPALRGERRFEMLQEVETPGPAIAKNPAYSRAIRRSMRPCGPPWRMENLVSRCRRPHESPGAGLAFLLWRACRCVCALLVRAEHEAVDRDPDGTDVSNQIVADGVIEPAPDVP